MGKFKQVETQFIAAVGDPQAKSGKGAEAWGIWRVDPGPRGVRLQHYKELEAAGGTARAGWKFDKSDWWVEEHGLLFIKIQILLLCNRHKEDSPGLRSS